MFIHYSIVLNIQKAKENLTKKIIIIFFCIENNLRELGFGDIAVNKKMKDLNKIFYDILLKININETKFELNRKTVSKYLEIFAYNNEKWKKIDEYFNNFYKFCFDISPKYMIKEIKNFNF